MNEAFAKIKQEDDDELAAKAESKRQAEGLTPEQFELMLAVENKDVEVIKALLAAKVDEEEKSAAVNIRTANHGQTPLMRCAMAGTVDVSKELIKAGAQIIIKDGYGSSPLMYAAQSGCVEMAELFIEKGTWVNDADNYGDTVLMYARNNAQLTQLFLNIDDDNINHQNKLGATAVMLAGNKDVLRVLIKHGADVNIRDNEYRTALSHAHYDTSTSMDDILREAGGV